MKNDLHRMKWYEFLYNKRKRKVIQFLGHFKEFDNLLYPPRNAKLIFFI